MTCHSCPHVVTDGYRNCWSCRVKIARKARQKYQRERMRLICLRRPRLVKRRAA